MIDLLKTDIRTDFGLSMSEITFKELDEDVTTSFKYQGKDYITTLPPIGQFAIKYDSNAVVGEDLGMPVYLNSSSYLIGEKDNKLYFITTKPKK